MWCECYEKENCDLIRGKIRKCPMNNRRDWACGDDCDLRWKEDREQRRHCRWEKMSVPSNDPMKIMEFEWLDFFPPNRSSVWKHDKPMVTTTTPIDICRMTDHHLNWVDMLEPIHENQTCKHIAYHELLSWCSCRSSIGVLGWVYRNSCWVCFSSLPTFEPLHRDLSTWTRHLFPPR